jgi:Uma2 family endonuclease
MCYERPMSIAGKASTTPPNVPFAVLPPVKHLRAPSAIHFPEEAMTPEGALHLFLRTLLQRILQLALGDGSTVGSEHFVYWNAREPKRCLSPDVFVKLGVRETWYRSWKTWEQGGVPELAVEIVSSEQEEEPKWEEKFSRYHELGVRELVRFDPEGAPGHRLRVWDRVDEDLVERKVEGDETPCLTLRFTWVVLPVERAAAALRLRDADGRLLPTDAEMKRAERERADRLEARLRALGHDPDSD